MAYAERRGDYYRGRYKNPPGVTPAWGTVSEDEDQNPFATKQKALEAAQDKESERRKLAAEWIGPPPDPPIAWDHWIRALAAQRRAHGGKDPFAGQILFRDWVEKSWLPGQKIIGRSMTTYRQRLKHQIYPAFGDRPINTLTDAEEINTWEKELRTRYALNTVNNARNLLSTILGDASSPTARLVDVNAAEKRRNRGPMTERREQRIRTPRKWVNAFQLLMLAERAAILTGDDQDLVMLLVCGWCGLRWGELMALQEHLFRDERLFINSQMQPAGGGSYICDPPKEGSYRDDRVGYFGALDLPEFLVWLLTQFLSDRPPAPCRCDPPCGGKRFMFLNARGSHIHHDSYTAHPWRLAADGRIPSRNPGLAPRPVLMDMAAGWPGKRLSHAWPAAEGPDWRPPRGPGQRHHDLPVVDFLAVPCPTCSAPAGIHCLSASRPTRFAHRRRKAEAERAGHVRLRELASWVPIATGLTPHGLRHSHRVMLDEVSLTTRIPDVLMHDRFGHSMPGIGGTYTHTSPTMRAALKGALQALWETALARRLEICPTSPVPLLNRLLAAEIGRTGSDRPKIVSQTSPDHGRRSLASAPSLTGEVAIPPGPAERPRLYLVDPAQPSQ